MQVLDLLCQEKILFKAVLLTIFAIAAVVRKLII